MTVLLQVDAIMGSLELAVAGVGGFCAGRHLTAASPHPLDILAYLSINIRLHLTLSSSSSSTAERTTSSTYPGKGKFARIWGRGLVDHQRLAGVKGAYLRNVRKGAVMDNLKICCSFFWTNNDGSRCNNCEKAYACMGKAQFLLFSVKSWV